MECGHPKLFRHYIRDRPRCCYCGKYTDKKEPVYEDQRHFEDEEDLAVYMAQAWDTIGAPHAHINHLKKLESEARRAIRLARELKYT